MIVVATLAVVALVAAKRRASAASATGEDVKTTVGENGLVYWRGKIADAADLARASGVHPVSFTLARVMASETSPKTPNRELAATAIAHVVLNEARRKKLGVLELVADDDSAYGGEHGRGRYGRQWRRGRYCASQNDPTPALLALAERIRVGQVPDPTGGAVQWDSPRSQEAQKGTTKTADEVAAARIKEGKQKVLLAGVPEDHLRLWRFT